MKNRIFTLAIALIPVFFSIACVGGAKNVKPGIDVLLEEELDLLKGKRVGLITNPSGVNSQMESTVDLLYNHPDINLVALFGPEHGVRGDVTGGFKVDDFVDPKTGVPVYSLYGKTRKPTPEMLKNVDVLIYDIQDIGSRAYTYIYTMALSMEAAAEQGKRFVVLDRPNPLGGNLVEGPVLDTAFSSFIGLYPIPFVYGLTVGELAQLFNSEFDINVDLTVVPLKHWKREMTGDKTGLEWVITSPHIPHSKTALFCAATGCIGELYTIDIGVGYTMPFELIGEEWMNANQLSEELNSYQLPGVFFRPLHYKPYYFTREGTQLQGVQIHVTDVQEFKPMLTQIHILCAIRKLYPEQLIFDTNRTGMFDKAMGTDKIRQEIWDGKSAGEIIAEWQNGL
ncbi:MAG: DUF1343 domain-containing protein, partial [Candidatus Marinimicrobia bacterium]|nr:DUF1343 domain-containing protein [Candidatus Neomarinimicrobiota bacterium]